MPVPDYRAQITPLRILFSIRALTSSKVFTKYYFSTSMTAHDFVDGGVKRGDYGNSQFR